MVGLTVTVRAEAMVAAMDCRVPSEELNAIFGEVEVLRGRGRSDDWVHGRSDTEESNILATAPITTLRIRSGTPCKWQVIDYRSSSRDTRGETDAAGARFSFGACVHFFVIAVYTGAHIFDRIDEFRMRRKETDYGTF